MTKPKLAPDKIYDLFIIGGGVNGCGIARDASGRGYSVGLAEMGDIGGATSSSSTKLFHGGLRYLEYFEFRLVREALVEREILLNNMPHISWPLRFVLPISKDMHFDNETPTGKLLGRIIPWTKGKRPAWVIRTGLFLYDTMGGRKILKATKKLNLRADETGKPLKASYGLAYEYSDAWVQDSRLVVLNAQDAAARGADIFRSCKALSAKVENGLWQVEAEHQGKTLRFQARMLVNATGPWVADVLHEKIHSRSLDGIRLVRGSHIVLPKLYDHDKCYIFQGKDGRIVFAIPYEHSFTLIGTTDAEQDNLTAPPHCTPEEAEYLCRFVSEYFEKPVTPADIIWSYSGVRPLYDDGASSATAATREYVLKISIEQGAPLLNVFGGKITTYRKLAEAALNKIDHAMGQSTQSWTKIAPLPGGNFAYANYEEELKRFMNAYPFFEPTVARRLWRTYGTECFTIFGSAKSQSDLGVIFAQGVSAREMRWAIDKEWVETGDDFLWRRTRLGLHMTEPERQAIHTWIKNERQELTTNSAKSGGFAA